MIGIRLIKLCISEFCLPDIHRDLTNVWFWPEVAVAGLINNRYSERIEGQVTAPFRSFSHGLYNQCLNDRLDRGRHCHKEQYTP